MKTFVLIICVSFPIILLIIIFFSINTESKKIDKWFEDNKVTTKGKQR